MKNINIFMLIMTFSLIIPVIKVSASNNSNNEKFILYAGIEEVFNENKQSISIIKQDISRLDKEHLGWTTDRVNIREEPNINSKILGVLDYNEAITYHVFDNNWATIDYYGKEAYVDKRYLFNDKNYFEEYSIPDNNGFKSYMSYHQITNKTSIQYELQNNAYTGNHGIRMIKNRYCIALGTYFNAELGSYVDLILENGSTIPCVISEIKSDKDTDENNIVTSHNGCVAEFIVDTKVMNENSKKQGDISFCNKDWDSQITIIRIYKNGVFKEEL